MLIAVLVIAGLGCLLLAGLGVAPRGTRPEWLGVFCLVLARVVAVNPGGLL